MMEAHLLQGRKDGEGRREKHEVALIDEDMVMTSRQSAETGTTQRTGMQSF